MNIWEEKNLTDHSKNVKNNNESDLYDITTETEKDSIPKDWKDITDPKLRRKMRQKFYDRERYFKNKENRKIYLLLNKDKIKKTRSLYREKNKDVIRQQQCQYEILHRDHLEMYRKKWCVENKVRIREKNRLRRQTDIQYKLKIGLRNRLRKSIQNKWKNGSAVRDLGCSIVEFKSYLESKFQEGMSWDNWSLYGWHIDHIKPLSSFDLTDRKQLLEACHYTNLQPLWARDNLSKRDFIHQF